jgi:hypothetical protein
MSKKCINLNTEFPEYKTVYDPACDDRRDTWMFLIPGRLGTIYPYGGELLAVEVNYHPSAVRRLEALGLQHVQDGDGEHTFLFRREQFRIVARIIKAYRKRKLAGESLERKRNQLSQARESRLKKGAGISVGNNVFGP